MTNMTTNRKKKNFAIAAAPSAILPNPKIAATIAITKKIAAQRNMVLSYLVIIQQRQIKIIVQC